VLVLGAELKMKTENIKAERVLVLQPVRGGGVGVGG
jgi:hypothetical protein